MIKVLIVDDSPTVREGIKFLLSSDKSINVIGSLSSAEEALEFLKNNKPDVITMDIMMEGMNGFTATKKILEKYPIPIIIVSSCYNNEEIELSYKAIEAGAVSILPKPTVSPNCNLEAERELTNTVKAMSSVKIVKRRPMEKIKPIKEQNLVKPINLIVMGASTGGPPVLLTILSGLPKDFNVPILIVQHISKGFLESMVNWLQQFCKLTLKIARDSEPLLAGTVYFAPYNYHMGIDRDGKIFLSDAPAEHSVKPSVSFLFESVLNNYKDNFIAILLTGMGRDGSKELVEIYNKGHIAIAQDKESSVVFGMPGEALKMGKLTHVLPPEKILQQILFYCKK